MKGGRPMLKPKVRKALRRWLGVLLLLSVVSLLVPAPALAWNPCGDYRTKEELEAARNAAIQVDKGNIASNIAMNIILSVFDMLDGFFISLGARPVCNLVFGLEMSPGWKIWAGLGQAAQGNLGAPEYPYLHTFTEKEWKTVQVMHTTFFVLTMSVLVVVFVMFAGLRITSMSHDYMKRAHGMYTLQSLGVTVLLVMVSPILIPVAFDVIHSFVTSMADFSRLYSGITDFMQALRGEFNPLGAAVVRIFSTLTLLALNMTYTLRRFVLMVLIILSPVCILMNAFDATRPIARTWLQEFIGNLLIQPVHAILLTLFFMTYGQGGNTFVAIAFLLVLQPMTNMLVAVLTGGRASSFTGMGQAAALMGVAGAVSLGSSIKGTVAEVLANRAAAAGGGALNVVAGSAGAAAGAAGAAGAPGAAGAGVETAAAGGGGALPMNEKLARMQATGMAWRKAGKVVGGTVGAVLGAGLGLAGGNAGAGAMLGARFGSNLGGSLAGIVGSERAVSKAIKEAGGSAGFDRFKADFLASHRAGRGVVRSFADAYEARRLRHVEALRRVTTAHLPANASEAELDEAHRQAMWTIRGEHWAGRTGAQIASTAAEGFSSVVRRVAEKNVAVKASQLASEGYLKDGDTFTVTVLPGNGYRLDVGSGDRITFSEESKVGYLAPGTYRYFAAQKDEKGNVVARERVEKLDGGGGPNPPSPPPPPSTPPSVPIPTQEPAVELPPHQTMPVTPPPSTTPSVSGVPPLGSPIPDPSATYMPTYDPTEGGMKAPDEGSSPRRGDDEDILDEDDLL